MATRYVWSKYNVANLYVAQSMKLSSGIGSPPNEIPIYTSPDILYAQIYRDCTFDSHTGLYNLTHNWGDTEVIEYQGTDSTGVAVKYNFAMSTTSGYTYLVFSDTDPGTSISTNRVFEIVAAPPLYDTNVFVYCGSYQDEIYGTIWDFYIDTALGLLSHYVSGTTTSGAGSTNYGYVMSASSGAYPSDGSSGSYWYVYQGSDSIDPTAVSYSTTTPKGGDTITIHVTAGSNTYGGTISYKYQYSANGGSTWTTLATSTATSYSYTIPKGTTQFQARVLASDNYGFTSTTYVTGANLTVKNTSVYAGVNGVVTGVNAIVCVDGVVKTNVSMYQGVDGTVKQS